MTVLNCIGRACAREERVLGIIGYSAVLEDWIPRASIGSDLRGVARFAVLVYNTRKRENSI